MTCNFNQDRYDLLPPQCFGGPTGNYAMPVPIPSNKYAEFAIVSISNGDGGAATVTVSGSEPPPTIPFDGSVTLNAQQFARGEVHRVPADGNIFPAETWSRLIDSRNIYARIDAAAATSVFITIKFRVRVITLVPAPAITVDHEHPEDYHQAREERILSALGRVGEIETEETFTGKKEAASVMQTRNWMHRLKGER